MNRKIWMQKYAEKCLKLLHVAERDEMLYGDAFIQFNERGIKVLDPTKVKLTMEKK